MKTTESFTEEYFFSQICEFRKAFGSKEFWAKPIEIRDAALKAINFCYLNTETKDQTRLAQVWENTVREYGMRGAMLGIET